MTDTTETDRADTTRSDTTRSETVRHETAAGGQGAGYVDYGFAKAAGRRLVPAGPQISPAQAREVVEDLRRAAAEAVAPVAETSGLRAPDDAPGALVVDRPGWISLNVDSFEQLISPVVDKLADAVASKGRPLGPVAQAIGGKLTGGEMGALLAFLSTKILGQYDLAPGGTPQLLLVAPNIVEVQRRLEVDGHDFRRWVAMHEETHRVQFTAVPWLREHMVRESQQLAVDMAPTPDELTRRIDALTRNLPDVLRSGEGIGALFATPEQKAKIAELTAVMSLLEGHADVVMDDVGPKVIPSVAEIRRKFDNRRSSAVGVDRILRKLLGLDAKMRQYRDGAAFVRAVTDSVGRDGFNAVWTSPETLPRAAEILDPQAWVTRVHG